MARRACLAALGWGCAPPTGGILFGIDPSYVFWMGSAAALLLMLLLVVAKPNPIRLAQVMNAWVPTSHKITTKTVFNLFPSAQDVDVYSVRDWRSLRL